MQISVQQWRTSRERRSYKRFAAERRVAEVDALRAAAGDLRIVGQMDSTQTVEWLDHRAGRLEHPEPPRPLTPGEVAACIIGAILLIALTLVIVLNTNSTYVHPV